MARNIRTKTYLKENNLLNNSEYLKQIYKKNLSWNPPPASSIIEEKITEFEKALKTLLQKVRKRHEMRRLSNLNHIQWSALQQLRHNKDIIIKPSDKNLGPTAMDTTTYIRQVLQEHLLTSAYRQLSQGEAKNIMERSKTYLKELLSQHSKYLSKPELTYFQRSLKEFHRLPIFYGLPKVHKEPISLRPVVSTSGSLLAVFSTWIDFKMKELLPLIQSHVKNSLNVIEDLKNIVLPKNALIFTADAVSMYTNIKTDIGISTIKDFLSTNLNKIPENFPHELFLQILECIMTHNVFSFSDTYWLQLTGTAMGTPSACSYATITFGHFENSIILENFKHELLYYKRYIDDIIGIWLPPSTNARSSWNNFKHTLNSWGDLQWKIEEPSSSTTFLDLEIQLTNNRVSFKTYQKEMNLYLYIPPFSAHPPSCFKGLIAGEIRRYWMQNNPEHFQKTLTQFINRLLDRGHSLTNIIPILMETAESIDKQRHITNNSKPNNEDTLFIHRVFHPYGLSRQDIRRLYSEILEPHLQFNRMTIAMSRPTNLRDLLTKASLTLPQDINIQRMIQEHNTEPRP